MLQVSHLDDIRKLTSLRDARRNRHTPKLGEMLSQYLFRVEILELVPDGTRNNPGSM
jgi:hypothetical protein